MECSLILSGQEALGEAKQLKVLTARLRFQSIMNRGIMTSQHVGEATARTGTGIRTGTGRYSNSGSCWGWVGNQTHHTQPASVSHFFVRAESSVCRWRLLTHSVCWPALFICNTHPQYSPQCIFGQSF